MHRATAIALLFAAAITLPGADRLHLVSGAVVDGRVMTEGEQHLRVLVDGEVAVYARRDVVRIERGVEDAGADDGGSAVIPAGTPLRVVLHQRVGSERGAGWSWDGSLVRAVQVDGAEILPVGTPVFGTIADARSRGTLQDGALLALELTGLELDRRRRGLATHALVTTGDDERDRALLLTGGGAAIGAIADGSDGALAGAAIGLGAAAMIEGDAVVVPAESVLTFRLSGDLRLWR